MAKKNSAESEPPDVVHGHIDELRPDVENRRRRTPRGRKMLIDSLTSVGAARSIVVDESNTVRAGNGIVEAAREVGITKIKFVDADGDELVAVRRRGLNEKQLFDLALYDNRAGELAEWNPEQLATDAEAGQDISPFFNEAEQRKLLKTAPEKTVVAEVNTGTVQDRFWISIEGPLEQQAATLTHLKKLLAGLEDVSVELGTVPQESWK